MTMPSEGIKDLLVNAGFIFGGTGDWAVYIGRRPDVPKNVIAIIDTPGNTPNPRWLIDYPSVQILVRGDDSNYVAARNKAVEIKNLLLGLPSQDINGDRWVHVNMAGDIGFIGFDDKNQPSFSMNFNLIIEPAPTASDNREPL